MNLRWRPANKPRPCFSLCRRYIAFFNNVRDRTIPVFFFPFPPFYIAVMAVVTDHLFSTIRHMTANHSSASRNQVIPIDQQRKTGGIQSSLKDHPGVPALVIGINQTEQLVQDNILIIDWKEFFEQKLCGLE